MNKLCRKIVIVILSLSKNELVGENVSLSLSKTGSSKNMSFTACRSLLYIPHNDLIRAVHNDLRFAFVFFYHTGNADMLVAI